MDQQTTEDYLEMLIRWMQRKNTERVLYDGGIQTNYIKVWGDFRDEYPADADALEVWLKERHSNVLDVWMQEMNLKKK